MIIGNGLLSNAFKDFESNKDVLIFASGTSNSNENNSTHFIREETLLLDTIKCNKDKVIVYFSTCSIEDESQAESMYVQHKIRMEELITSRCKLFYIFRLPQVVGVTRSKTLINFLFSSILNDESFSIYENATRNLIDVDDVFNIGNYIIANKLYNNEIINLASPNNEFVTNIVKIIEGIVGKKAKYNLVEAGKIQYIDVAKIKNLACFNVLNDERYLENTLVKFYKANEGIL